MLIEDIINFILQNFVFFLILLFGLSRFFSRTTSSSEEGKEFERNPLPPVAKPFFDEWEEKDEPPVKQKDETFHEQIETMDKVEKTAAIEFEINEIKKPDVFSKKEELEINEQKSSAFQPSNSELANAVIWSEILGPPRAYKKHRLYR